MHISNTSSGICAICYKPQGAGTHCVAVPVTWPKFKTKDKGTTDHDSN